jgi:hypothetical protein
LKKKRIYIPFALIATMSLKIFGAEFWKVSLENGTYIFVRDAEKYLECLIARVSGWGRLPDILNK